MAVDGGGVIDSEGADLTIIGSLFERNKVTGEASQGGAIRIEVPFPFPLGYISLRS